MESFSQYVGEHMPWLIGLTAWLLGTLLIVAIIGLPAYFIFFPIARRLRDALYQYFKDLKQRHAAGGEERRRAMDALIDDFGRNSGITCISERTARIETEIGSFLGVVHQLRIQLTRINALPQAFGKISNKLAASAAQSNVHLPEVPTADALLARHGSLRETWIILISCLALLLTVASVNTGMLSQILRELGVVPRDLSFLGIPLYLVFAFMLTLVEAGIGLVSAYSKPSPNEPHRLPVVPVVATLCAIVIACVEGYFYSNVAPGKSDSIFELPGGIQVRERTLFFLWGASLVTALFLLGDICAGAVRRIGRSANDYPAMLHRFATRREQFAKACESAEASAVHIAKQCHDAQVSLESAAGEGSSVLDRLNQIENDVGRMQAETAPARQLTAGEVHHFMHVSGLWFLLTLVCALATVGLGFFALTLAFRYTPLPAAWFAALGVGSYFVVLGLMFPRGDLLLSGVGSKRLIVSGSAWRGPVTIAMAVLAVVGIAFLLWRLPLARYQAALWIIVVILGGSLAAAASQTAAAGKGLRLWFASVKRVLIGIAEALVRMVLRILLVAACFLDVISLAFAAPIFAILRKELPSLSFEVPTKTLVQAAS